MNELSIQHQTIYAELIQKCLDASFDADFPENGSFFLRKRNDRGYWYYNGYDLDPKTGRQKRYQRYAGPESDSEVTQRVGAFGKLKNNYTTRTELVRSLRDIGLPIPDRLTGETLEALWKAGAFRMRCVLIGTTAFQTYAGLLGIRLPNGITATEDIDLAQYHSVSVTVEDKVQPIVAALEKVDPSFRPIPHSADSRSSTRIVNGQGYAVEFLTPNRSSDDYMGLPAPMPALGGMSAEPLRFLDFLIRDAVWAVILHKGGIPVRVPLPERYAVHKLIVATRRRADARSFAKSRKDIAQAESLIEAMDQLRRIEDLGEVWIEAHERGPHWREALNAGYHRLQPEIAGALLRGVERAAQPRRISVDEVLPRDAVPQNGRPMRRT